MPDFSQYQKFDIPLKTIKFTFPQLEKIVLDVLPATEKNKPYFNALLKHGRKASKAVAAGAVNVGLIEDNRDNDRLLYAKYIVRGWENVTEKDGKLVPFNEANCLEFLKAIDFVFDTLREFCSSYTNFMEDEEAVDVEGQSKN